MHSCGSARLELLQDFARSHPVRLRILALVAKDERRSLDPVDLSHELPKRPDSIVVSYHARVLQTASLLPAKKSEDSTA
jgi:hypothetical protein